MRQNLIIFMAFAVWLTVACASVSANPWKTWVALDATDQSGQQVDLIKNRLKGSLDRLGHIVEDSSALSLRGQIAIVDSQQVDGFQKAFIMLTTELTLSIAYEETGSSLGSETFESKGGGDTYQEALREVYKNFKFSGKKMSALLERAQQKLKEKLEAINLSILNEGKQLFNQNKKDEALLVLVTIVPNSSSYPVAEELMEKIKDEKWQEYLVKLEHERKLAEEKTKQDSARAEAARLAAEKAADSLERAKLALEAAQAHAKAMEDSLAIAQNEIERERIRAEVEKAKEKTKQMQAEAELAQTGLDSARFKAETAKDNFEGSQEQEKEVKAIIDNGPDGMSDCVLTKLAGGLPKTLIGKWKSREYQLTLSEDCYFVMTSPHEPKRVAGSYVVSPGRRMKLTADDNSLPPQQLNYTVDSTGALILEGHNGFKVRFEKA